MDGDNTDDNNDNTNHEIKLLRAPLKVYWNVPSFQCNPFLLNFADLLDKYNIIHNDNADFRGENINILYDPGKFPAILKKGDEEVLRNGGVPQEGNLTEHLEIFTDIVNQLIPDENNAGLAIIDFESWRPIYRQHWGKLLPYQTLSEHIERQKYSAWPEEWIKKEAARRFDEGAKLFMEETLKLAKELRPKSLWGYYHFPYCFGDGYQKECSKLVMDENDRINWLFDLSDSLYPSVYLQESYTAEQRVRYIETSLDEAIRIRNNSDSNKKIYVYYWYKYQDTGNYLSKQDLFMTLTSIASYNIDGLILWGASADVSSKSNCVQVYEYIDTVFGPTVIHV
ncbi:unnamed protein product [Ceutorhynchus assimilis]|uniref:Hyaluronidase n=1 Tax=Ceutorhynchus assimilis TaxID=467358 RepID=A0A9N9MMK5_9CUCU|nr:unnamed protein product [Ceutorhynchus assimilis]